MKENNNNKIQIIVFIVTAIIVGVLVFCMTTSGKKQNNTDKVSLYQNTNEEKIEEDNTNTNTNNTNTISTNKEKIEIESQASKVKESSKDNALEFGEWANAGIKVDKFVSEEYENVKTVDVPVSVTKIVRGEEATNLVKDYTKNHNYKYQDPKDGMEWAVCYYNIDLTSIKFGEKTSGISSKVDAQIRGLDDKNLTYNGLTYLVLQTQNISENTKNKKEPGVYEARFAAQLPKGCTDYLIKLGYKTTSDEGITLAYFKGK